MRRYLPFLIVAAVGILTLGGGAVLYRAQRPAAATTALDPVALAQQRAAPVHVRGPADARVTIEEFADFECPPCAGIAQALKQLEEEYRPGLRIVFRHFPLRTHKHAGAASFAAEAAGLQGKFWEMHDLLFENQVAWSRAADPRPIFEEYAARVGLDVARFKADVESTNVKKRIASDQQRGTSLGVSSTPALFVNDLVLPDASANAQALREIVHSKTKPKPPP